MAALKRAESSEVAFTTASAGVLEGITIGVLDGITMGVLDGITIGVLDGITMGVFVTASAMDSVEIVPVGTTVVLPWANTRDSDERDSKERRRMTLSTIMECR